MAKLPLENGQLCGDITSQNQTSISRVSKQSLQSTRRMVTLCENAKEAGLQTIVALDNQGEQIDKIEKDLRDIYEDMVQAEQALDKMNGCCWGVCETCMEKTPKALVFKNNQDDTRGDGKQQVSRINGQGPGTGGFIARYTKGDEEQEMENNMAEVSNMVGVLRNMAIDIGDEIVSQNLQLDRININAGLDLERVDKANKMANKLLK